MTEAAAARDEAGWVLEPDSRAPADGRTAVGRVLEGWGLPHLVEDAQLVTSELVANAVAHAHGAVRLRVSHADGRVRIEVGDRATALPRKRRTDPLEPGGLGLVVVEHVAESWGAERRDPGKIVWAELVGRPGRPG